MFLVKYILNNVVSWYCKLDYWNRLDTYVILTNKCSLIINYYLMYK
jgi:hypothetical protein